MRGNLDACRRTRTEVQEAQQLEREIGGVYEAGQQMFAAAIHATRERAAELKRGADEARKNAADAEDVCADAERVHETSAEQLDTVGRELKVAQTSEQEARALLDLEKKALAVKERLDAHRLERNASATVLKEREVGCAKAEAGRDTAQATVGRGRSAQQSAALGLANAQTGLEQAQRRAHAHRAAVTARDTARRILELDALDGNVASAVLAQVRSDLEATTKRINELDRSLRTATQRRIDHEQVRAAVERVCRHPVLNEDAPVVARQQLDRLRGEQRLADSLDMLRKQHKTALELAPRQEGCRVSAERLGLEYTATAVRAAHAAATTETTRLHAAHTKAEVHVGACTTAHKTSKTRIAALELRRRRWSVLLADLNILAEPAGSEVSTTDALADLRTALEARHRESRDRHRKLVGQHEALLEEASQLEVSGGTFPDELTRLRDHLEGELLASMLDDIDIEKAAHLEAHLGPLVHAIVVPDPMAAATKVSSRAESLPHVYLIAEDQPINLDGGRSHNADVITTEAASVRVSRKPNRPTLGRPAREARTAQLRREAEDLVPELDTARSDVAKIDAWRTVADRVLERVELLGAGDPANDMLEARHTAAETSGALIEATGAVERLKAKSGRCATQREAVEALLAEAWLLDEADQRSRATELHTRVARAQNAELEIERTQADAGAVSAGLALLDDPPPTEAEVTVLELELEALREQDALLVVARTALDTILSQPEALGWTDAEQLLSSTEALVPGLRAQLELANAELEHAEDAEAGAATALEDARRVYNVAHADFSSLDTTVMREEEELADLGIELPSAAAVDIAADALDVAARDKSRWEGHLATVAKEAAQNELLAKQAREKATKARDDLANKEREATPARERWERLEREASERGILASTLTETFRSSFEGRGSINVWSDAETAATLLRERLNKARSSEEATHAVNEWLGSQSKIGERYLAAWLAVRDWLLRRLPAQIAEVDEPLEALSRLSENLAALESRLSRQEDELRGDSADVANSIAVKRRKAQAQVRKLTRDLEGVSFGSIRAIRVLPRQVERMERVLKALKSGELQADLFNPDMPIEEALDEIFRRYAGGRTGGQRLLDYREYMELTVEVKRLASDIWVPVNPTHLSTGEAIGVGAALMMVVLTAWERHATMFRSQRAGSMRFLFLDEANRLDPKSLDALFDLCEALELQLLIAAPTVERVEGCSVFRLVRLEDEHGHEQVLVTGRRAVAEP
jgi:chromosome partition protein MukB